MKYSLSVRALHALLAFLIIAQLILGFSYTNNFFDSGWIINLHKSFGVVTFFVIPLLVIARIISVRPAYKPPLPLFQLLIAKVVHLWIYISAFSMAFSGVVGSMLMGFSWNIFFIIPFPELLTTNVPLGEEVFSYHYIFSSILLILVIIHIAAALSHQLIVKDNILNRMK
ncbi:branched-chain alpha-keto acid dehydrogenase subunit E2 [Francisella persica ATCC VR-331]|uniref:Branched-chain alpha-keto acid dehydrogenase subunit E2 n=1 Tax=Francisella persica ATCC VR-331 TaxID=1086726 RepID=A0AAC8ZN09_9GAMM|nr:cytochrome b/b6 domain-containing protein [Francisella persica]ALB02177.1 branched-chain alpha-keto acid dehydrogenase subunit E2 [Francisella persica ATCC VR-331]ANH77438.1 branched-chain alpha-keto acid dehydrogenase subunit E2 [Francisella persica ATCC VR-331]